MPRKDLEEEKEFEEKNKKEVETQIISDSQLLNMKLDKILENQLAIIELMSPAPEESQTDSTESPQN